MTIPDAAQTSHPELSQRLAELAPIIDVAADEAELRGELGAGVIDALQEHGVFLLMAPKAVGGAEANHRDLIDVISGLSYTDGSTGWTAMAVMLAVGIVGAYFGDDAVDAVFAPDRVANGTFLIAGQAQPRGKAERVGDGYRVSGSFGFGSGSHHASWMLGGFVLHEAGEPVRTANGPKVLFGLVPGDLVELRGNWDVMGLRATGSDDYWIPEQVVPVDYLVEMENPAPQRGGELYHMGRKALTALSHASFPLGVAQRSLDELQVLSHRKKRVPGGLYMYQPTFQRDFAEATAALSSARAYVRESFDRLLEASREAAIPPKLKADVRLAASHAVQVGVSVTHYAYLAAGSDGLRNFSTDAEGRRGNRLQRAFRDMHAASQHLFTAEQTFLDTGQVFLEVPDASVYL
jgi:alkylation response protein AidB-like acyl-CoA dehydrogenase